MYTIHLCMIDCIEIYDILLYTKRAVFLLYRYSFLFLFMCLTKSRIKKKKRFSYIGCTQVQTVIVDLRDKTLNTYYSI